MRVTTSYNPLSLKDDQVIHIENEAGLTPTRVIEETGLVFTRPFVCLVNGEPVGRAQWDHRILRAGDVICFIVLPHGGGGGSNPLRIIAMLVVIVAAMVIPGMVFPAGSIAGALLGGAIMLGGSMLVNALFPINIDPAQGGALPAQDPTYSVYGGANRLRIGSPWAENFGRNKIYPDLIQATYTEYAAGDTPRKLANKPQYLYFLGIVGVGTYDIEGLFLDDTPADDFEEIEYQFLPPGSPPTLVPVTVWPCRDLQGQTLSEDWLIAIITAPGVRAQSVQIDLSLPGGLYSISNTGRESASVSITIQMREVDDDGDPIGATEESSGYDSSSDSGWVTVWQETWTRTAPNALNVSIPLDPPAYLGRHELRIKRSAESGSDSVVDEVTVGEIRSYGEAHGSFGDATLVEAKVRASKQLTGNVAERFNVLCTRKLYPVTDCEFSDTLTATRSIVDAIAYIVTCTNGGQQDDTILDWATLYELRQELEVMDYHFDWRFQTRSSVMDAIAMASRCARAMPFIPARLMIVQDVEQTATIKFTQDDYTKDTFSLVHKIRTSDDPSGVEIHYIDQDVWEPRQVQCYDSSGSQENMAVMELSGCTSRQHAWEIGMWMYWVDQYCRTSVSFSTGLKGHIPLPGQRILVDVPATDFQHSGKLMKISGGKVWLSEDVEWDSTGVGVLYISGEDGELAGPYNATPGDPADDDNVITCSLPGGTATVETDAEAAAKYLFAWLASDVMSVVVSRISPSGPNGIRIDGNLYDARVFQDPGLAPAYGGAVTGQLLAGIRLTYIGVSGNLPTGDYYSYYVQWYGTAEAVRLEVDEGGGYAIYTDPLMETREQILIASALNITAKITPYYEDDSSAPDSSADYGALAPGLALTDTGSAPGTPTGLNASGTGEGPFSVSWSAVSGASKYKVMVWVSGTEEMVKEVSSTSATFSASDILAAGGPWPSWDIYVAALDSAGKRGKAAHTSGGVSAPDAPSTPSYTVEGDDILRLYWAHSDSDPGPYGYVVYHYDVDNSSGFDPDDSGFDSNFDPATEGTLVGILEPDDWSEDRDAPKYLWLHGWPSTAGYNYYFKVAAYTREYPATAPADLNWSPVLEVEL